jgi:hypothetical protein
VVEVEGGDHGCGRLWFALPLVGDMEMREVCGMWLASDSDSVTLLGAILGAIESLMCGTHMSVVPTCQ